MDDFKVEHVKSPVIGEQSYYPFGLTFNSYSRENSVKQDILYNGKELQDELDLGWLDYGARMYSSEIGKWSSVDRFAEDYFSYSPYNYVRNNPILRVDVNGEWDITVHVYNNREQYGYGVAIVNDKNGNEIYRFTVRVQGAAGSDRTVTNADTPLGTYDIPDCDPWIVGGDRQAYGPNARLKLDPESGEISDSGRDEIRVHGGRQEVYNEQTKEWEPAAEVALKKTNGCLRAYDSDMANLKKKIDELMGEDPEEKGGKLKIVDDLQKDPLGDGYTVPGEESQKGSVYIHNVSNNDNYINVKKEDFGKVLQWLSQYYK